MRNYKQEFFRKYAAGNPGADSYMPRVIKRVLSEQGRKCAQCGGDLLIRRDITLVGARAVHRACKQSYKQHRLSQFLEGTFQDKTCHPGEVWWHAQDHKGKKKVMVVRTPFSKRGEDWHSRNVLALRKSRPE